MLVSLEIGGKAARLAEPLRLGQMLVGSSKIVLGALAIVDVGEEHVPPGNVSACVAKRKPANLKPPVDAIETPDARLES